MVLFIVLLFVLQVSLADLLCCCEMEQLSMMQKELHGTDLEVGGMCSAVLHITDIEVGG